MKRITIFLLTLFLFTKAIGQDAVPSFGKISREELEIKDCDFDPGAEAIVLLDIGEMNFAYSAGAGWQYEVAYRMRIKILKASALDRASIKLRYSSRDRENNITDIRAVACNLDADGNVVTTQMESSSIFTTASGKEYAEVAFAIPNVKIGTVIEYKYKKIEASFGYIPAWRFQQKIPVKYSAYCLHVPEVFTFTIQSTKRQEIERYETQERNAGSWFIMRNVPGLQEEPLSSGIDNYYQRIEFQLSRIQAGNTSDDFSTTWPKLISELMEDKDFGGALKRDIDQPMELVSRLASVTSDSEKIHIIYNYVQQHIQWNDQYRIYSDDGLKAAWNKKQGNIADINFILVRFLQHAGVHASPLLVSTKDNGYINPDYPFLNQFNAVMAYAKDGDKVYVMNAADKYNPFQLMPYDVLFTDALLVDKENGGVISLNSDDGFSSNVFVSCSTDADGKLLGQVTVKSTGYARNIRLHTYRMGKLKAGIGENSGIPIQVDTIMVRNADDEMEPFIDKVQFHATLPVNGEYLLLPLSLFSGIEKKSLLQEKRIMDIDFDFPRSYVVSGSYIIGEGYGINELPKNVRMLMPDTGIVITRSVQPQGNIINFRIQLDIFKPLYLAADYAYIKEFFKKMYNILDEKIVLKKTSN